MQHWKPCILSSGLEAQIVTDSFMPEAVQLVIAGTPQSHVNLADPGSLFFEYVQRMGSAIDAQTVPGKAISALHLGGGAYTLPRYIAATRPGSLQQVIEIDENLINYIRETVPLPKRAKIKVRRGDAREKLASLPAGMLGKIDVVVVDVFSGSTTPAHLTTLQFYKKLKPFMHDDSILLINSANGPGHVFVKKQLVSLQKIFKKVAAAGHLQTITGKVYGNVVLIAANKNNTDWEMVLRNVYANGPHPARVVSGSELKKFVGNEKPIYDAEAVDSPPPPKNIFGK